LPGIGLTLIRLAKDENDLAFFKGLMLQNVNSKKFLILL
jgi:hypothetical protein